MDLYKTTISDFASGPPANPSTGDSWYASNVRSLSIVPRRVA